MRNAKDGTDQKTLSSSPLQCSPRIDNAVNGLG